MDNFNYNKNHCYQYDIRLRNYEHDLAAAELTEEEVRNLKVSDFHFKFVPKENKILCAEIRQFIERHEWLGKMPTRPTHRFIALYKGKLAGAVIMATPNSFSNLLGSGNRHLEKLISRGACISWSPKNLASALIMYSIRRMVKNTQFRYFTAYSDIEARELGTIYQACNFTYLGQNAGGRIEYFDSTTPERGWFSDRLLRKASQYKRYANQLNITWQNNWSRRDKIYWENIPTEISQKLKAHAAQHQRTFEKRNLAKKHKYVYILGQSKNETHRLRHIYRQLNPEKYSYPKIRGPRSIPIKQEIMWPTKIAATNISLNAATQDFSYLTQNSQSSRPQNQFLTIKEASNMFNISDWTLYQFIKTDPTFPYFNVGMKKKFVIEPDSLTVWLQKRTRKHRDNQFEVKGAKVLLQTRYL